jgi:hypothetical protein
VRRSPSFELGPLIITQQELTCEELHTRQTQWERAAHSAQQPRDSGWADPMEQLLRAYFAAQLPQHPAEHVDINCRTDHCLVTVKGLSNDALLVVQRVMGAVDSEAALNLRHTNSGSSGKRDNWTADFELHRR